MPIELGDLQLTKIHHIHTLEDANFVYQSVPGMSGEIVQDFNRASVRLKIEGIFYGEDRKAQLDKLRKIYLDRQPVDFIVDMLDQAYASQVIVETLTVGEQARWQAQFNFSLVVREYVKPPAASTTELDKINQKINLDAQAVLEISSLPDALATGSLPELVNPFKPLNQALDPIKEAGAGLTNSMTSLTELFN